MTSDERYIREAILAGTWYEGSAESLEQSVRSYLDQAEAAPGLGTVIGLIAPHAGHIYSGPVAGHAYKAVQGLSYEVVVVVAPNHADPRLDFSSVMTAGGYRTPLGLVPVDETVARAIAAFDTGDAVRASTLGHTESSGGRYEHSLEIQLPFLQVAIGEFSLVPVVMGNRDQGKRSAKALGQAIAAAVEDRNALIVASTDLSHFHDVQTLQALDEVARKRIEAFDPDALLESLAYGETEACGGLPVAAVMFACRELGATTARVLNMANSGDVSGDFSSAVGYLAAAITKGGDNQEQTVSADNIGVELGISEDDKQVLRDVVEQTLESVVNGGEVPAFEAGVGALAEHRGAFVTLNSRGQLRGCIGHIVGTQPLVQTVADMARAAALEDPRFPAVTPSELSDIDFEISVLTPIREITDIDEIVIGRDGLIVTNGWNRGLLLPQVAAEYGWDRIEFLEHTCIKAGLPRDAWNDPGTTIEMFSAQVFD